MHQKSRKNNIKDFILDKDVVDAIDRIEAGSKSDTVSKIIRIYLQENNLL